jgi:hypothetical protein
MRSEAASREHGSGVRTYLPKRTMLVTFEM